MKNYITNFPVYLALVYFPITSLLLRLLGIGINYDMIWGLLLIVPFLFLNPSKFFTSVYVLFFSVIILGKYFLPFFIESNLNVKALVMDGKYLFYMFFVFMWTKVFGHITIKELYKSLLFFSILYIVFTIVRLIFLPSIDREGILMEANYDGFMMLLGLCIWNSKKNPKTDLLIFALATFCTFSRTGVISMSVLLFLRIVKHNLYLILPAIPVMGIAILIAISIRGHDSVSHLDRFIFFEQTYVYLKEIDMVNLFFGSSPGVPLKMTILPSFEWYIDNFEESKGVTGIFPFYFHSTYLRLMYTWGIVVTLAFIVYLIYKYFESKSSAMKYLCVLILIQSISLSTLTIPNLSILVFLTFITLNKNKGEINYLHLLLKKEKSDSQEDTLLLVKRRSIS